ncbi:MAG: DUF892 family protein [Gemmataceae bacterium]
MAEDSLTPPTTACDIPQPAKGRRTTRSKTNPSAAPASAAESKPRTRRTSKRGGVVDVAVVEHPAAPVAEVVVGTPPEPPALGPMPEAARQTVESLRQADQELQGIRTRRDEVAQAVDETARQLAELDRRAAEVRDQTEIREAARALEGLRTERDELIRSLADASQRLADLKRQASEAKRLTAFEQEANEAIAGLQADREELVGSMTDTARQLAELQQQAEGLRDLDAIRQPIEEARGQIAAAAQEAATLTGDTRRAAETCQEVSEQVHGVQNDLREIREAVDQAEAVARRAREQATVAIAEADQTRQELGLISEHLRSTREEAGTLTAEVRRALDELRTGIEEARREAAPPIAIEPAVVAAPVEAPPIQAVLETQPLLGETATGDALPEIAPLPDEELAGNAGQRLLRFLNDAWAVESEQVEQIQQIAAKTIDPDVRALLEEHHQRTQQQVIDLQERMAALHVQPTGGRGLLNRIVTRVWDVLQEPLDERDDTLQRLLQALSAAEFEAGMYLTLYALARGFGEPATAELAAAHYHQEREFATRLRGRIVPTALRASRKLEAIAAPAEPTPAESAAAADPQ